MPANNCHAFIPAISHAFRTLHQLAEKASSNLSDIKNICRDIIGLITTYPHHPGMLTAFTMHVPCLVLLTDGVYQLYQQDTSQPVVYDDMT